MKTTTVIGDDRVKGKLLPELLGQLMKRFFDIIRRIEEGTLSFKQVMSQLQAIAEGRAKILPLKTEVGQDFDLKSWETFYKKFFNIPVNLSGVKTPDRTDWQKKEFTHLLVVAKGLTNNQVFKACQKQFPCSTDYSENLDTAVPTNERDPKNGAYAIWVRDDEVESKKVHRNMSAKMIEEANMKTETLLERILHELVYFSETGKHMDMDNRTLCCGSRDSSNNVPNACWHNDNFHMDWNNINNGHCSLRSREIFS